MVNGETIWRVLSNNCRVGTAHHLELTIQIVDRVVVHRYFCISCVEPSWWAMPTLLGIIDGFYNIPDSSWSK
jgi:hypothetical protein